MAGAREIRVASEGRGNSGVLQITCFARQGRDFFARSDVFSTRSGVANGRAWSGKVSIVGGWPVEVRTVMGTLPKRENRERGEERRERKWEKRERKKKRYLLSDFRVFKIRIYTLYEILKRNFVLVYFKSYFRYLTITT